MADFTCHGALMIMHNTGHQRCVSLNLWVYMDDVPYGYWVALYKSDLEVLSQNLLESPFFKISFNIYRKPYLRHKF